MRLLACQLHIPAITHRADKTRHLHETVRRIDVAIEADGGGVDLIVLPELSSIDYSRDAFANLAELAEPLDGESRAVYGELAQRHGTHVCFGMPRVVDNGYRIAQVVVGPQGELIGYYDKLHVAHFGASMEKDYFQRGDHLFHFDVAGFRCAPIICYDHRFGGLTRHLCRDEGVDLILHSVAFYRDGSFASWHHFAVTRALENQVYLLSLNRAGEQWGQSLFCPPWADTRLPREGFGDGEALRFFELDRAEITRARETYPLRTDELADYAALPINLHWR